MKKLIYALHLLLLYVSISFGQGGGLQTPLIVKSNGTFLGVATSLNFSNVDYRAGSINFSESVGLDLTSTNPGNEGISHIGAFGGYTLDEFFEDTYQRGPSRDKVNFSYQLAPSTNLTVTWSGGNESFFLGHIINFLVWTNRCLSSNEQFELYNLIK